MSAIAESIESGVEIENKISLVFFTCVVIEKWPSIMPPRLRTLALSSVGAEVRDWPSRGVYRRTELTRIISLFRDLAYPELTTFVPKEFVHVF